MKKITFVIIVCLLSLKSFSQSSTGLIAHWNFNGGAADVSGNGHTGYLHGVTPDTGMSGMPNTAYYFDGVSSYISASYASDLNLTNAVTICAVVKVKGFYSGTCQANSIFTRGNGLNHDIGSYNLSFDDNHYDSSCSNYDTTLDIFFGSAYDLVPGSYLVSAYTPTIVEDRWYKVVSTFNDTVYKLYVNDTLKMTASVLTPGLPIGTSTDSISIGNSVYGVAAGWGYYFNGIIDDIRLYNRVLSDSEITTYGADSCGRIVLQPTMASAHIGSGARYTVSTTIPGPMYQWQQDGGTGFLNLSNSGPYSGVTTDTLNISVVSSAIAGDHYRCLISNTSGCSDTTVSALLTTGITTANLSNEISIYPNPANNIITVQLPEVEGEIKVINEIGQVMMVQKVLSKINQLQIGSLPSGVYIVRVECSGSVLNRQLIKY